MTKNGAVSLKLEQADTEFTQSLGLMWRKRLNEREGMLFRFNRAEQLYFWMKNTLIPLDIIFIDDQGKIVRIYKNAEPNNLALISSKFPAQYVIELAAGSVEKYDIKEGDKVLNLS